MYSMQINMYDVSSGSNSSSSSKIIELNSATLSKPNVSTITKSLVNVRHSMLLALLLLILHKKNNIIFNNFTFGNCCCG